MAVVEVIEDNLPPRRLLILVELFSYRCLAFGDTFTKAAYGGANDSTSPRHFTFTFFFPAGNSGCLES